MMADAVSTTDEVESVETVIQGSQKAQYLARQQDSFNAVGGGPQGWREAPIKDMWTTYDAKGKAHANYTFDIPPGYKTVTPWTDRNPEARDNCELCGWSPLVYYWPILNDEKKLKMDVGSECVGNFMGAGYLTKVVKTYKMTVLRKAFETWSTEAQKECETHRLSGYTDRYGSKHIGWLPEEYYHFESKLGKLSASTLTSRKLVNIFKAAYELHLTIPGSIAHLLGLPDAITVRKLDEKKPEPAPVSKSPEPTAPAKPIKKGYWEAGVFHEAPSKPSAQRPKQHIKMEFGKVFVEIANLWYEARKDTDGSWAPIEDIPAEQVFSPRPAAPKTDISSITTGVYETPSGDIYVVRPNRDGTRHYAKKLKQAPSERVTELGQHVNFEFEYDKGAIFKLKPEYRMSEERAKELTVLYGHCIVCGRTLKEAKSVERGIGPVCIKTVRGMAAAESSK